MRTWLVSLAKAGALGWLFLSPTLAQRTTVEFWHSMGGVLGEATEKLVQAFNRSQPDVQVKSQYVGSYDDGINKLLAALRAGRGYPHVIQVYDIGARIMADSGAVVPLEDLARRDGFDLTASCPNPETTTPSRANSTASPSTPPTPSFTSTWPPSRRRVSPSNPPGP